MHTYIMYDMTSNNRWLINCCSLLEPVGYSIYLQTLSRQKRKKNPFHHVTSSVGEPHKSYKY